MAGTPFIRPAAPPHAPAHRGEQAVFALLAILMLGALVPIRPAAPGAGTAVLAAACHGPVRSHPGHASRPCRLEAGVALAAPSAALRMAALLSR